MKQLKIAPIVEGHGEVGAVRVLLERIAAELLGGAVVHVLQPIRRPRERLIRNIEETLSKAVRLAVAKLRQLTIEDADDLVLILLDADQDCAAQLGPDVLGQACEIHRDVDFICVLAVREYETWFVAAAASLEDVLNLDPDEELPADPEQPGCRKNWIQQRIRGRRYSETVDQPKLTSRMDLQLCRRRSPSFDKLCRELQKRQQ